MKNELLTKELLEQYRKHPRVLEVRFILLFDLFEREFGYNGVMSVIKGICLAFNRNSDLLDTIIARRFDIKRKAKTAKIKWRQEIMFMGLCYGETPYRIAKEYLMISPSNFYRKSAGETYDPNVFVTNKWLEELDDEVKIAGGHIYRNEIKGFLDVVDSLTLALMKWKGVDD